MDDVFMSYKREERERAKSVADGLRAEGISVFLDAGLQVGQHWDVALERRLDSAKAVAVLWSELARKSYWVRSEARRGQQQNKLVPARLDGCTIPLGFDTIQEADLRNWSAGDFRHFEWRRFIKGISALVRSPASGDAGGAQSALPLRPAGPLIDALAELKADASTLGGGAAIDIASYRYSAARGEPWAAHMMGIASLFGFGVARDEAVALEFFRAASAKGWSGSHYVLGVIYECGVGVRPNVRKAITHYRRAAKLGHEKATNNLLRLEIGTAA
jgi:hypothetical protein